MRSNTVALLVGIVSFIAVMLYGIWSDFTGDMRKYNNLLFVYDRVEQIKKIDVVMMQIQRERGLSSIALTSKITEYETLLKLQRQKSIDLAQSISDIDTGLRLDEELVALQQNIDYKNYDFQQSFMYYSNLITKLSAISEQLVFETHDEVIKNSLIIYLYLKRTQEQMGQLRASIGAVLASHELSDKQHSDIVAQYALLQSNLKHIQSYPEVFSAKFLLLLLEQPCLQDLNSVVKDIVLKEHVQTTPMQWYEMSTCAVDTLYHTSKEYLEQTSEYVLNSKDDMMLLTIRHLVFWLLGLSVSVVAFIVAYKRTKELDAKGKLLLEYKMAIDRSAIVSKTDRSGIITYANDAFCKISGYDAVELIGQPHSIVRHPDTPKKVFKDLWHEIKSGHAWHGVVQNRRKDGESYWVEATITPVYDDRHRLVEYIAIRHDITDIVTLSSEVQNTQREMIYRLGEAVESRSKESGQHIKRVALYSQLLAKLADLSLSECEIISVASTMHDVGKIAIADSILHKTSTLTPQEREAMREHAKLGYKILRGSNQPLLKMAANIAYEHHERYDGSGYPRGLKGEDISIYGRIVAIADVFDALSTKRAYKDAWSIGGVFEYIQAQSGKQFDPRLVKLMMRHCDQFVAIKYGYED